MAEKAKTTKFFARMFVVFLARHNPDSTQPNPAFIQNTRNAVSITHNVSIIILMSAGDGPSAASCAKAPRLKTRASNTASGKHFFNIAILLLSLLCVHVAKLWERRPRPVLEPAAAG